MKHFCFRKEKTTHRDGGERSRRSEAAEGRERESLKRRWELLSDAEAVPRLNAARERLSWKQRGKAGSSLDYVRSLPLLYRIQAAWTGSQKQTCRSASCGRHNDRTGGTGTQQVDPNVSTSPGWRIDLILTEMFCNRTFILV